MTVLEAIQKSTDFLAKKGVAAPRLQAEWLLAHQLQMPRMKLYLNFARALTPAETDGLREAIRRRAAREPLQHIVGSTSFCGCEISVNRHALVPRPETEQLAELGWQFLNQLALRRDELYESPSKSENNRDSQRSSLREEMSLRRETTPCALDFGTGTGCIAIALAAKCPAAKITALDISPDALALARQNAAQNKVAERIEFFQGDGFAALPPRRDEFHESQILDGDSQRSSLRNEASLRFDLIISNPPYIATAEIETLEPEVKNFDPRPALDGGADGLDFYRRLAREAGAFLKPGGKLMVEMGDGQAETVGKIFTAAGWLIEAVHQDLDQRARILAATMPPVGQETGK